MSPSNFGGQEYTSRETRTLRSIYEGPERRPASNEELAQMLQTQGAQIRFLARNQKQLAKGVNEATQNPIQQIQQFISDIVVLLGGGQLAQGVLDFGDLQYILPALGALFGFGDTPFPLNLIAAAEKFFFGYVVPTQAFTDLINHFIESWLAVFGIDREFVDNVQELITAVGFLFDGVTGLLPNVNQFFNALGITAAGLGPLGVALAPIIKLFEVLDLTQFGNAVEFITDSMNPFIVQLTASINFLNALLRIFGTGNFDIVNSPLPQLTLPFLNLQRFLGSVNFAIASFNPIAAVQQWLGRLMIPIGSMSTVQPNLQLDGGFDDDASIAEDSPAWAPEDLDPLIDYPEGWLWDLEGRTAPGSATVDCDGADHAMRGTVIPVEAGQTFDVGCYVTWTGVTATGSPFKLQIVTDADDVTDIAAIASPAASAGWTVLAGNYTVPADVETIRLRLFVDGTATAGQIWWDDAAIRRTSIIQKGFIAGLVDDLTEIFANFAAMIDGILGTGHTFGQLVTFISAGLSQAASAMDNFGAILSGLGGGLANIPALVSFLNTANNNALDAADAFSDLLAGAGEDTAATLGALIADLLTMLTQISNIFNGAAVTPINTVVQQIKDWWTATGANLPAAITNALGMINAVVNAAAGATSGTGAVLAGAQTALNTLYSSFANALQGLTGTFGQEQMTAALKRAADQQAAQARAIAAIQSTISTTGSQNNGVNITIDYSGMANASTLTGVMSPGTGPLGLSDGNVQYLGGGTGSAIELAPTPVNSEYVVVTAVFGPLNDLAAPYTNRVRGRIVARSNSARTIYTYLDWTIDPTVPYGSPWFGVTLGAVDATFTDRKMASVWLTDPGGGNPWLAITQGGAITLILGDPVASNPYACQVVYNGTVVPLLASGGSVYLGSHTDAAHFSVLSNRYVGLGATVSTAGKKPPGIRSLTYRDNAPNPGSTPYANLPTAGNPGRRYTPSDVGADLVDNGTTWDIVNGGPLNRFKVPPAAAGWGRVNTGTSVLSDDKGRLKFTTGTVPSGEVYRIATYPIPTPSLYSIKLYVESIAPMSPTYTFNIGVRNSISGNWIQIEFGIVTSVYASSVAIRVIKVTSASASAGTYVLNGTIFLQYGMPNWWRIRDDGSIRYYEYSYNNVTYTVLWSTVRSDYIIPDQFMLAMFNQSGQQIEMNIRSMEIT